MQGQTVSKAPFASDKLLLILGQDLGAVGGFPAPNNDGYIDHVSAKPGGVTTYLALPGLKGMTEKINLWSGDLHAQAILDNPKYNDAVLVIGLYMVDAEEKIAAGEHDDRIRVLAEWIKAANRPVFLRIGYEFDGSWNHYKPEYYKKAFQRIVNILHELKVSNCATVWQACTSIYSGNKNKDIQDWYPGDEFVDWMGYSWFISGKGQVELTDQLLSFARAHKKPVMVCESAPQGYDLLRLTKSGLSKGDNPQSRTADQIWREWYVPFFDYINKNRDAIKAVAYINVNWDAQLMWGPPYRQGYWGDSRVEANEEIKRKWEEAVTGEEWMKPSPESFETLGWRNK